MSESVAREPLQAGDPDVEASAIAALALNVPLVMFGASLMAGVLASLMFAAVERGLGSAIVALVALALTFVGWMIWSKVHSTAGGVRRAAAARVAMATLVLALFAAWYIENRWPQLSSTPARVGTVATTVIVSGLFLALVTRSAIRRRRNAEQHARRTLTTVQALIDGVEPAWVRRIEQRLDAIEQAVAATAPAALPAAPPVAAMSWRQWWRIAPWRQ